MPPAARPSRRLAALGAAVVAAVTLAACVPVEQLPPQASSYCASSPPTTAAGYQQAFDGLRTVWTEWAAADGGLPTTLPDGRVLWTFGDTLVGRVRSDGSVADSSWVRNSFVVQTGACFAPLMGGARGARTEILPNPAADEWYWPSDAVVEDGGTHLRVFSLHLRKVPNGSGGFDFSVLDMAMSTFSLPGLTLVATVPVPVPTANPANPQYGQTVVSDGTYLYAYGPRDIPNSQDPFFLKKEHRIARVPLGQEGTASAWEFGAIDVNDAATWSTSAGSATPMHFAGGDSVTVPNGPRAPLAVIPDGAGDYLASGMPIDGFAGAVDTWSAPDPWGPWTHVETVVSGLPTAFGTTWAYGGRVVALPGTPATVLWSQNHNPVSDIVANNAWYKVHFAPA